VGIFDFLTGKTKLEPPKLDGLFAMSTAAVTLEQNLGLRPSGAAAICFKPLSSRRFREGGQDLNEMVQSAAAELGSTVEFTTDTYGYEWSVIRDPEIEDVVTEVNVVAQTLTENGFGEQLLCAVFGFDGDGGEHVRLLYNFKRGRWYPFVQTGGERRDTARELDLQAKLEKELPLEPDLERWFPLYGAPV
jgi:hypothetical protein